MTVLERIKETARSKRNISLTVLEQQLGYSNGSLAKAKDIPSSRIKDIADFLEVSMEYLMTGEEPESGEVYYLNDETREIAQEIFENPNLRSLFDMSRKMSPDRLKAHIEFMKNLQASENKTDI